MADAVVFQIEEGEFGIALVDKSAAGYSDSWQAPEGKTVDVVTLADYDAQSQAFTCQVTSSALTAAPNITTLDIPATLCNPAKSTPQAGETSYSLDLSFLQDPNVAVGLSRRLFEWDTKEAFVYLSLAGGEPPRMIGRARIVAGTIGGGARVILTADTSFPLIRKPDVEFGDATTSEIVTGGGAAGVVATGATAGTPGSFTPTGATTPANIAALATVTASPLSAWTTGQHVVLGDASHAHWDSDSWETGDAA
jgi:hypothetical protein